MNLKHNKNISKLKNENDLLSKTNHEHEEKVNKMQEKINELEKKNLDLHNILSKVHNDHEKQLELLKSRPGIMFSVRLCARYQSCPKESHLQAFKGLFRYLKDTSNLGLWYFRDSSFSWHAFSNADFGGCKIVRKSTSGACQFLGNMLISWFSKKQNSVVLPTTEA
ncbi:RVT_2 domain-containing protein [Gossypium australe]|uniref:RVT_2 domain-containing protein n=1 Tax=Gossypium australe TaxID=47621 RepID=A0A5B6VN48_9ROSI|nr:RVT_2 domain-containing protein [Gossypium australe]